MSEFINLSNVILTAFGASVSFLLKINWDSIVELKKHNQRLSDQIMSVQVLVAGDYVKRDDNDKSFERVIAQLETINQRLTEKADR